MKINNIIHTFFLKGNVFFVCQLFHSSHLLYTNQHLVAPSVGGFELKSSTVF